MDLVEELPDSALLEGVALEISQPDAAVQQRAGDNVLLAELALQRRPRVGVVGMRQALGMNQDVNRLDLVRIDIVRGADAEHGLDRRVGGAAAGVFLEANADADQIERITPIRQHPVDIVRPGAVEDVEEALLVFEGVVIGRKKPSLASRAAYTPVPIALADMQRLGHRSEIGF